MGFPRCIFLLKREGDPVKNRSAVFFLKTGKVMAKKQSLLEIHTAVVLFGLAGLFGKWLALSPFIIVLGRVFFASAALGLFFLLTKKSVQIHPAKSYSIFILLGFLLAVHWVAFFQSIQISTVAVGLLSYSSFPVFTAFFEPLFFKEKVKLL